MKTLEIELAEEMAREVEAVVATGSFDTAAEVVRAALRELISPRRFELQERQQLEDVVWAVGESERPLTSAPAASPSS